MVNFSQGQKLQWVSHPKGQKMTKDFDAKKNRKDGSVGIHFL